MRICNYPGRAVDATLALDQKSPMETLYQNNWLNADKTIKTIGRKSAAARNHLGENDVITNPNSTYRPDERCLDRKYFSQSSGSNTSSSAPQSSSDDENRRTSISSLGRYQLTLEQMQKLDLNQSNELFRKTMRNLNGYKPSTIRQKHRRNYAGWDEFKEKATIDEEIKQNQNADRSPPPSNGDLKYYQSTFDSSNNNSKKVILIPKIKRSQTMRITSTMFPSPPSPSSPPPLYSMNVNGSKTPNGTTTINLRNVFNRQQSQEQQQQQQPRMPTATINKNFNRFKRNNLPSIRNGINNDDGNDYEDDDDVDDGDGGNSIPNRNGHNNSNGNNNNRNSSFVATENGYKTTECIIPSNFSQFTMKSNGCIKNDKQKPNGTCDNEFKLNGAPSATKKKPLLRAKSVRINPTPLQDIYYDRMMADRRESNGDRGEIKTTSITTINGISTNCDKRSNNNINNNNINGSNGTSERVTLRQKLPRLTSIMKKKPIVISDEPPSRPPQQHQTPADGKPILDQWINFHHKKSKGQQPQLQQQQPQQQQWLQIDNGKSVPNKIKSDKNSSTSSLSSMSSGCADCNSNVSDFSIPRPRLIVPVHTYARKRRTGNLIQVNRTTAAGDYDRIDANNAVIIKQPRNSSNINNKQNNGKREQQLRHQTL